MANNFSDDWRRNNPTMYQSRKTGICHLPGSRTTLILTVGVIVFYLSVSTFMIASLRRSAGSLERMNPACDNHKKRDYGKQSQSDCNDCFIRTFEDRASFFFFAKRKDDDSRGIEDAGQVPTNTASRCRKAFPRTQRSEPRRGSRLCRRCLKNLRRVPQPSCSTRH